MNILLDDFETEETILSEETFRYLSSISNEIEKVKEVNKLRAKAKEFNILKNFDDIWKIYKKKKPNNKALKFGDEFCSVDNRGESTPKNLQVNVEKLLDHYNIGIRYNELKKEMETIVAGKSGLTEDNKKEILEEYVFDKCVLHDFKGLTKDRLSSMLLTFADENKYNPMKEYLIHNYEQNKSRVTGYTQLKKLSNTLISEMDKPFMDLLITTWLVACVKAAFSKCGFASHGVLVLQGAQGLGKTSWFRSIVPNPEWFMDGKDIDVNNKDSILTAIIYWIVELGEIGSTVKKDYEKLKAFLTKDRDEMRRAYARKDSYYPRRTMFCGSVNPAEFLQDDTGNRRFWTIPISECNYKHDVDIDLLWAEIVDMENKGHISHITAEAQLELAKYNRKHEVVDFTETLLVSGFKWEKSERYLLRSQDVFRELNCPIGITLTKITKSLKKMGLESSKTNGEYFFKMPVPIFEHPNFKYKPCN